MIENISGEMQAKCDYCDWVSPYYSKPGSVIHSEQKHLKKKHKEVYDALSGQGGLGITKRS